MAIGMLPSASLGDPSGPGVFEPCHGSAPDIGISIFNVPCSVGHAQLHPPIVYMISPAGQDKANPLAQILSAAMVSK